RSRTRQFPHCGDVGCFRCGCRGNRVEPFVCPSMLTATCGETLFGAGVEKRRGSAGVWREHGVETPRPWCNHCVTIWTTAVVLHSVVIGNRQETRRFGSLSPSFGDRPPL